jgi:hypothetical protein
MLGMPHKSQVASNPEPRERNEGTVIMKFFFKFKLFFRTFIILKQRQLSSVAADIKDNAPISEEERLRAGKLFAESAKKQGYVNVLKGKDHAEVEISDGKVVVRCTDEDCKHPEMIVNIRNGKVHFSHLVRHLRVNHKTDAELKKNKDEKVKKKKKSKKR